MCDTTRSRRLVKDGIKHRWRGPGRDGKFLSDTAPRIPRIQMRPPLKKLLFCARLEAYWHPQTQHLFLSPSSYIGQAFAAGIVAFLFLTAWALVLWPYRVRLTAPRVALGLSVVKPSLPKFTPQWRVLILIATSELSTCSYDQFLLFKKFEAELLNCQFLKW